MVAKWLWHILSGSSIMRKIKLFFLVVPVKSREVQSDLTSRGYILPHSRMQCADWCSPSVQADQEGAYPQSRVSGGRKWVVVGVVSTQAVPTKRFYEVHIGGFVLLIESLALGPLALLYNGYHLGLQEGIPSGCVF